MHFNNDYNNDYYDQGTFDQEGYDDYGQGVFDLGPRNRYENAYGDYRGGYGPAPNRMGHPGPMLPPPLPPPSLMGGLGLRPPGYRREEPPAIRYLMRCGLPRESLKGLPRSMLNLIQPDHCGLCGHNFETFPLSRTHYLSKNHQRAQKKWLAQNNSKGHQNPLEAPLKSRELYCELCDVEITSKVHAESHYAGKSHQAVVDGRKNPKNPILLHPSMHQRLVVDGHKNPKIPLLLHPGMHQRLQQLIRREKKFLNKASEMKTIEDKDMKPPVPELYCEICKTSVTCSDQMTAHLNGKRHLTKEKQHILKQMRGEDDSDQVGVGEENTEGDTEEAGDGEGYDEGEDAEYNEGEGAEYNEGEGAENNEGDCAGVAAEDLAEY